MAPHRNKEMNAAPPLGGGRARRGPDIENGRTDPMNQPGTHWIAICVDTNGHGEYFDSFGRKPPEVFEHHMNQRNAIHVLYLEYSKRVNIW